jgi:hypothetical protein
MADATASTSATPLTAVEIIELHAKLEELRLFRRERKMSRRIGRLVC